MKDFFLSTLLHADSKHDDAQAFFLLPLLTFILSYLPKMYDWQSRVLSPLCSWTREW